MTRGWDLTWALVAFCLTGEGIYGAVRFDGWWTPAYATCAWSAFVLGLAFYRRFTLT